MKQLINWSIIILFVTNLGGFFYIFKIQEYAIKKEIKTKIKEGVPKNELHTFILSESNESKFEWKHSKEFKYEGMMYDVVYRTLNEDGTTTLQCVSDIQETILFNKLDDYLAMMMSSKNNGKHPVVEFHIFLSHLFCVDNYKYQNLTKLPVGIIPETPGFYSPPSTKSLLDPPRA